jgi:hypothetical protein
MAMSFVLTFGRGLFFCVPFLLDSPLGSSFKLSTEPDRISMLVRKDDTHNSKGVIIVCTSRLLLGKEYRQMMDTKLTMTSEKASKRLQRSSRGSRPSRPAVSPTFSRGVDECWPVHSTWYGRQRKPTTRAEQQKLRELR